MNTKPYRLAVKAVIGDEQGRCLLIRRSSVCRNFVGQWEWPGGKVDPGEGFAAALVREVREETALEVAITGLAGATSFEMPAVHVILLCLEARPLNSQVRLSDEHDDSAWVPLGDLARYSLPSHVETFMIEYARQKGSKGP